MESLNAQGYRLNLLHNTAKKPSKHTKLFDNVIDIDFSSEKTFASDITNKLLGCPVDGLLCAYENYIIYRSIAADILGLPAPGLTAARASTDKYEMRSLFARHNPALNPRFCRVTSEAELLEFSRSAGYPIILKPTNLVKSLLVSRCDDEASLISAYQKTVRQIAALYRSMGITNRQPGIIAEQFISGKMCSVAAFVDKAGVAHMCDGIAELVTAQAIGYDDNFLYSRTLSTGLDEKTKAALFHTAQEGITALGLSSTPAHVELIYQGSSVKIVEIGARIGGYRPFLYEQSYGIDLVAQEVKLALSEHPEVKGTFSNHSAMFELFPRVGGVFRELRGAKNDDQYAYINHAAHRGDQIGRAEDGHKATAIIGIVESEKALFDKKCQEVSTIEVVLQ